MSEKLLQRIFKRVYGKPSWQVHKGHGSFLTFEFGKPRLDVWEKVFQPSTKLGRKFPMRMVTIYGDWHLWIYLCHWQIYQSKLLIGHSESSDKKIDQGCGILNGQILKAVVVHAKSFGTDFHFDLGGALRCIPYGDVPKEMWMLRCPNDYWFSLRSDGKYAYDSGKIPPNTDRWHPFIFNLR